MSPAPSPNATRDLSKLRIDREPPRPARRLPWWIAGAAVALAIVAVALPRITGHRGTVEVTVAQALLGRPPSGGETVLASSGYVVARTKAAVSAKIAGRLEELAVEEGSRVQEGEVIARLENDALQAEVDAASAGLAQAEAALARARADLELARVELARQRGLFEARLGTQSALDTASASAAAREAGQAEAASGVRAAQAHLRQARVGLENANVRAPFSGVVLRKEAEVGEYVAPSVSSGSLTRGAIVTMADLASLEVETDIAEGNVARLADAMPAEISLDAVPDRPYRGRLRQVMPTAERQKATVQVKVALLDPDDRVKPEMSAKVRFLSQEPSEGALSAAPEVTVPAAAIAVAPEGGAFAWVVVGGRARRVPVTLGPSRAGRVVVASGLSGTESVVLDPPSTLKDGVAVRNASP